MHSSTPPAHRKYRIVWKPPALAMRACANVTVLRNVVSSAKLLRPAICWLTHSSNSSFTAFRISALIPVYEPRFRAAARSSALKQSTRNWETGNRVDFPLPGGPATTNIRGCGKSASEVPARFFPHVIWNVVAQQTAFLIENAQTNAFIDLGLDARVSLYKQRESQRVEISLVVQRYRIQARFCDPRSHSSCYLTPAFWLPPIMRC